MDWIRFLSGPLVGAVIGYFTNFIAVKMLFHPRTPIMLFGRQLPFTPGIIPKRKADLAAAIGRAVEGELFGGEQVKDTLLDEKTRAVVTDGIMDKIETMFASEASLHETLGSAVGEEGYQEKKKQLELLITDKLVEGIASMEIGDLIAEKGGNAIRERINSPFIAMFLTDDLIRSMAYPIGDEVLAYMNTDGKDKVFTYLDQEFDVLEETPLKAILSENREALPLIREKISDVYRSFVEQQAGKIAAQFHIAKVIEEKVAEMSNEALEELVLSVMENELGMIVKLGAVIGFVIGIVNSFI